MGGRTREERWAALGVGPGAAAPLGTGDVPLSRPADPIGTEMDLQYEQAMELSRTEDIPYSVALQRVQGRREAERPETDPTELTRTEAVKRALSKQTIGTIDDDELMEDAAERYARHKEGLGIEDISPLGPLVEAAQRGGLHVGTFVPGVSEAESEEIAKAYEEGGIWDALGATVGAATTKRTYRPDTDDYLVTESTPQQTLRVLGGLASPLQGVHGRAMENVPAPWQDPVGALKTAIAAGATGGLAPLVTKMTDDPALTREEQGLTRTLPGGERSFIVDVAEQVEKGRGSLEHVQQLGRKAGVEEEPLGLNPWTALSLVGFGAEFLPWEAGVLGPLKAVKRGAGAQKLTNLLPSGAEGSNRFILERMAPEWMSGRAVVDVAELAEGPVTKALQKNSVPELPTRIMDEWARLGRNRKGPTRYELDDMLAGIKSGDDAAKARAHHDILEAYRGVARRTLGESQLTRLTDNAFVSRPEFSRIMGKLRSTLEGHGLKNLASEADELGARSILLDAGQQRGMRAMLEETERATAKLEGRAPRRMEVPTERVSEEFFRDMTENWLDVQAGMSASSRFAKAHEQPALAGMAKAIATVTGDRDTQKRTQTLLESMLAFTRSGIRANEFERKVAQMDPWLRDLYTSHARDLRSTAQQTYEAARKQAELAEGIAPVVGDTPVEARHFFNYILQGHDDRFVSPAEYLTLKQSIQAPWLLKAETQKVVDGVGRVEDAEPFIRETADMVRDAARTGETALEGAEIRLLNHEGLDKLEVADLLDHWTKRRWHAAKTMAEDIVSSYLGADKGIRLGTFNKAKAGLKAQMKAGYVQDGFIPNDPKVLDQVLTGSEEIITAWRNAMVDGDLSGLRKQVDRLARDGETMLTDSEAMFWLANLWRMRDKNARFADTLLDAGAGDLTAAERAYMGQYLQGTPFHDELGGLGEIATPMQQARVMDYLDRIGYLNEREAGTVLLKGKLGDVVVPEGMARHLTEIAREARIPMSQIVGEGANPINRLLAFNKVALTTGVGVPRVGYFATNAISAPFQMFSTLGAGGTLRALHSAWGQNPRFTGELVKRLGAWHSFKPGKQSTQFIETPKGILSLDQAHRWAIEDNIVSSHARVELGRDLMRDMRVRDPEFIGRMERLLGEVDLPKGIGRQVDITSRKATEGFNWWQRQLAEFAHYQDMLFRTAVYVDALKAGKARGEAADLARKAMYDYNDMTQWERKNLRTLFTFYAYMRANAATQLRNMVQNPDRITRIARLLEQNRDLFQDEGDTLGELEHDRVRPLVARLQATGAGKYDYRTPATAVYGPLLPVVDFLDYAIGFGSIIASLIPGSGVSGREAVEQVGGELISDLAPVNRALIEETLGVQAFTGAQLDRQGTRTVPNWLVELDETVGGGMLRWMLDLKPIEQNDPQRAPSLEDRTIWVASSPEGAFRWRLINNIGLGPIIKELEEYDRAIPGGGVEARPGTPSAAELAGIPLRTVPVKSEEEGLRRLRVDQDREFRDELHDVRARNDPR